MRLTKRYRELIPETRWSITKGAISLLFREDDVGGRARVTTDEERASTANSSDSSFAYNAPLWWRWRIKTPQNATCATEISRRKWRQWFSATDSVHRSGAGNSPTDRLQPTVDHSARQLHCRHEQFGNTGRPVKCTFTKEYQLTRPRQPLHERVYIMLNRMPSCFQLSTNNTRKTLPQLSQVSAYIHATYRVSWRLV